MQNMEKNRVLIPTKKGFQFRILGSLENPVKVRSIF